MSTTLHFSIVVCCWLLVQTQTVSTAKSPSEVEKAASSERESEVRLLSMHHHHESQNHEKLESSENPEVRFRNPLYGSISHHGDIFDNREIYSKPDNPSGHYSNYFEDSSESSSESLNDGVPDRCKIDSKKRMYRPAKSFPEKKLPPPDQVYRSAHAGEDLVICWTETIIIKENRDGSTPNLMIHREYSISFESAAIIPEEHLECPRIENEIETSSEETAKYGVFEEALLDNTRQSRFVPYAMDDEQDDIRTAEQKIVRCASGSYIVRELQEWHGNSEKLIKRMQITVKPRIKYADGHPQARVPAEDPLDELFDINCTLFQTPDDLTTAETPTTLPTAPNSGEMTPGETSEPPEETTIFSLPEEIPSFTNSTATLPSADMICDNSTGACGIPEDVTLVKTTLPKTIEGEAEHAKNITTTSKTRSTWDSAPQMVIRPKMILKINVVLEKINDSEKKEQLMQVDKEVTLRDEYGNHTIMDKLKALNESVNDIETLKDLLNVLNDIGENSNKVARRRKRNTLNLHSVKKHLHNVRVVEQSLADIRDDIQTGLNEIVSKISNDKENELKNMMVYRTGSANFAEKNRERHKRSVDDETISRWSNERLKNAAGDQIRSFTELVVVAN